MILLSIVGFCLAVALLVSPNQSYSILRTDTAVARLGNWAEGWGIWSRSPVFGVGFNMLRSIRIPGYIHSDPATVSHATGGIDNWFMFLGATAGIPGIIAGVYFFWKMAILVLTGKHFGALASYRFVTGCLLIRFFPVDFLWLLALMNRRNMNNALFMIRNFPLDNRRNATRIRGQF